ncbi:MAG TPA: hypothetical protein VEK34_15440 [Methylocella sp.]|nr:hypothetical protein [Methylocella sp.]
MNRVDRLLVVLLWTVSVLVVAGITHIAAILFYPKTVSLERFSQISKLAEPGQIAPLPFAEPGEQPLPFADPAVAQSICPFDLSRGGLRLHADVEAGRLLTLSFHTSDGEIFYSMSDRGAQQGKIDVVVLTPSQLELVQADDDEDNPSPDLRLIAPANAGFVIISALAPHPSEKGEARYRAQSVACSIERLAGS